MGGPCCEHRVLVRTMRFRDVLCEYWRMVWARPPLREEEYSGPLVCRRCGLVMPETGGDGGRSV